MAYPLAITTFMEPQCSELMKPILSISLPKIGCIRSMPRVVIHGPIKKAGLNIPNLYTEQVFTQIIMLLRYGNALVSRLACFFVPWPKPCNWRWA